MPLKKISLIYEGEEELINAALEALSKRGGWKQLTQAELDAGKVQKTKEEVAKAFVTNFIRNTVKEYNAQQARLQAAVQSEQSLDLISVTILEE